MRLHKYIQERRDTGKKMASTMIGYKIDWNNVKNVSEYVKSWLDRYDLEYKQITDPHITVAQIYGKYSKDKITRVMQQLPSNFTMIPKDLNLIWGEVALKWFIMLEMLEIKKNSNYKKAHDIVVENLPEVKIFPGGMKPHTSLFIVEKENLDYYVWNELDQRKLKLPKIKINKITLYNQKKVPEFMLKKYK